MLIKDVREVTLETVQDWARRFSQVGLVLMGSGPPCQGVSGLNADRKGALRDARSNLFVHVSRIRDLVRSCFFMGSSTQYHGVSCLYGLAR